MKTDNHLDWLSVTLPTGVNWRQFLPFVDLTLEGCGRHGYGQAWVDRHTHARIETASTRDEMGTHLTLSGDVLAAMRADLGMIDDSLILRIQEYDGKCSRVDLAIDIHGAGLSPAGLNEALWDGTASIPAHTWRFIDGHRNGINGATIDTGSTASDRRMRFYDKRAEMRIKDGEAWVRLELQLRRLYAKAAVDSCLSIGVVKTTSGMVGGYLEWSNEEYNTALRTPPIACATSARKESKRRKWLLGQVARSLASECQVDPYFRENFNNAVYFFLAGNDR